MGFSQNLDVLCARKNTGNHRLNVWGAAGRKTSDTDQACGIAFNFKRKRKRKFQLWQSFAWHLGNLNLIA